MNSLNLKQIDGGNIIKQADSGSLFKFELLDENHKKFEEQLGDTATVILKKDTVAVFKKIVAVTDNCVAFNLDKILEVGDYILEIIVGSYVFPSNNRLKISVESTYGDYQPENLVRITYEEIDEKINELKDRLDDLNVAGQTEMLMRIEKLESKEDKDTIYDDTPIIKRIEKLESKEDNDTIYDDTELSNRVTALERKKDNDTIYDDSEIKRRITALEQKEDHDTIYNDTEIKQSVADVDTKVDNLSAKVTALEERPIVDTALTKRVEALEQKEDRDTIYNDSAIVKRIESLEAREDKDTIYNDTEIKNRLVALEQKEDKDTVYDDSNLVERIENLESDDTTIKERISALEEKPDKDATYDDTSLKAKIAELEEKLKSLNNTVKRPPYGYRLNRKARPWELIFDNGCILTFPLDTNHEYYGWDEIPIKISNTRPYNASPYSTPEMIMWYVKGHRTVEYLKTSSASSYTEYINYELKNPINDSSLYNFDNAFGDASDDTLIGKRNFVKLLYELDALIEADLLSVGVTKK